jgi:uncharacterized LabA/DUF88 family protein
MSQAKKKNYAFIDSQNVNLAIQDQGWRLDWKKFFRYLRDRFEVSRAFLFIGYVPENQSLYTRLQSIGYILVFKPTLELPDGKVKGNCDAELVLHTMIEFHNYHQAIIATGDGDFYCLVEYLVEEKKLCRLIVPNRRKYSALLRRFHEQMSFLNGTEMKLGYTKKGK